MEDGKSLALVDAHLIADLCEAHVGGAGTGQTEEHSRRLLYCRHHVPLTRSLLLVRHTDYRTLVLPIELKKFIMEDAGCQEKPLLHLFHWFDWVETDRIRWPNSRYCFTDVSPLW